MAEPESTKIASKTAMTSPSEAVVAESGAPAVPLPALPPIEPLGGVEDGVEGTADDGLMNVGTPCSPIAHGPREVEDARHGEEKTTNAHEKNNNNDDTPVETVGIPTAPSLRKISNTNDDLYENGYDSDGAIGPFFDGVQDEMDEEVMLEKEDEALPTSMGGLVEATVPFLSPVLLHIPIEEKVLSKMKVKEVRRELIMRGIVPKGKKSDQLQALRKALSDKLPCDPSLAPEEDVANKPDAALSGFPSTSCWLTLECNQTPVPEPTNDFAFRPPTLPEGEQNPAKFDYDWTCSRPSE